MENRDRASDRKFARYRLRVDEARLCSNESFRVSYRKIRSNRESVEITVEKGFVLSRISHADLVNIV